MILSRFVFSVHDIQNAEHLFEAGNAVSKQSKIRMTLPVKESLYSCFFYAIMI